MQECCLLFLVILYLHIKYRTFERIVKSTPVLWIFGVPFWGDAWNGWTLGLVWRVMQTGIEGNCTFRVSTPASAGCLHERILI